LTNVRKHGEERNRDQRKSQNQSYQHVAALAFVWS
jgi:hypothetical protein